VKLAGRRVLVVGMARSGVAAAAAAVRAGARVTCADLRADAPRVPGTEAHHGPHDRRDFLEADVVVVSPGVPAAQPDVAAAVAAGRTVLGELAFAWELLAADPAGAPLLLAVSGTNGKSTATWLLGQLLERAGRRTFTGGNLGRPLSEAVGGGHDALAVEVSSYQMELPGRFHPRAAAILNLTPDHLERHGSMDAYGAHKCRMFAQMGPGDAQILPAEDARLNRLASTLPGKRLWLGVVPGVHLRPDRFTFVDAGDDGELSLDGFTLPGAHNRANLAAACLLALAGGLRRDELHVAGLTGLPHRMELVREHGQVRWIDDSKATNVEAALAALSGLDRPLVALLGGQGKSGAAYDRLVAPLRSARVITFGASGPTIATALREGGIVPSEVDTLDAAVERAAALARPGDAVLLSPACASFDAFTDFEHRGRHFRALVEQLP